ncbi:MAG: DNA primase large subunit PriL [Methanosarcinales archaeon]|nr:DNA primase large subunit PriL [Methanosarcinales archaeon]
MDMVMEDMMPDPSHVTYPFTSGAAAYVRELGVDIPDLLQKRAYARARARGVERVIQAIKGRYLFSWDNVPGNDSERLLTYLMEYYSINWAEISEIRKLDGGKTIRIFEDEHSVEIVIDEKGEKATLKISDEEIHDLRVEKKNSKLHIYEGGIEKNVDTDIQAELEVLSYPIARMIVSCVNDNHLIRRYALAEAKAVYESLKTEPPDILITMGQEFGMHVAFSDKRFRIHFADYIRYAHRMHDPGWKLVNRGLYQGWVSLSMREFTRLLQEAISDRIQHNLPLDIPSEICDALSKYINEVKESLEARRDEFEIEGPVHPDAFPPCIRHAIAMLQGGINLPHSARFAVTSFLLNIGMDVDGVVRMFGGSPDFDETRTRYQVEHIAGREYTTPDCGTLKTYGNCFGADNLCMKVSHPLNYYRIEKERLFSWDNVPGNDSERLLKYLKDGQSIDWTERAKICKSEDGKVIRIFEDECSGWSLLADINADNTIHIFNEENSAEIMIDEMERGAILKISDGITHHLKVKKEYGRLNIYKRAMVASGSRERS